MPIRRIYLPQKTKSPFRYPGGKSRVRDRILALMPRDTLEYREPFVGGGSVFFGLQKPCKAWLNDVNSPLMAVYLALRDRPEQFIASCRNLVCSVDTFNRLARDVKGDQALRYYFINRTIWGGRVVLSKEMATRIRPTCYTWPEGWKVVHKNVLERASYKLQGVTLTIGDFVRLFESPGANVWIYADPPYFRNDSLSKLDRQYEKLFLRKDHKRFQRAVEETEHRVCVSYDDVDVVRDWAAKAGLFLIEESWTYSGNNRRKKQKGKELLLTNYDPQSL